MCAWHSRQQQEDEHVAHRHCPDETGAAHRRSYWQHRLQHPENCCVMMKLLHYDEALSASWTKLQLKLSGVRATLLGIVAGCVMRARTQFNKWTRVRFGRNSQHALAEPWVRLLGMLANEHISRSADEVWCT